MLVLPVMVMKEMPLLLVLAAFFVVHLIVGSACARLSNDARHRQTPTFPCSAVNSRTASYHVFATTADYATENPVVGWLVGGLNHHVVHHLCPYVCHTHYAPLTRIVKETAAEFGTFPTGSTPP